MSPGRRRPPQVPVIDLGAAYRADDEAEARLVADPAYRERYARPRTATEQFYAKHKGSAEPAKPAGETLAGRLDAMSEEDREKLRDATYQADIRAARVAAYVQMSPEEREAEAAAAEQEGDERELAVYQAEGDPWDSEFDSDEAV